jgi:hypothetical protein
MNENKISLYDQIAQLLIKQGYCCIMRRKAKKPEFYKQIGGKMLKVDEFTFKAVCMRILKELLNQTNLDALQGHSTNVVTIGFEFQVRKQDLKAASNRGYALNHETKELLAVLRSSSCFIKQEVNFERKPNQLPIENGIIIFSKEGIKFSSDTSTPFFQRLNASYNQRYANEGFPHLFNQIIINGLRNPYLNPQQNEARYQAFYDCLAYTLIPGNPCSKIFFIYGATQAGKSKLMDILKNIFGDYGIALDATAFINHSRSNPDLRPDLYRLDDKLFITVSETEKTKKLDSRLLKSISGGDTIPVRNIFSEMYTESKIGGNVFFVSNFSPAFANPEDRAIVERVVAIDWYNTIHPENRIKDLDKILTTHEMRSRIFSCLLVKAACLYNNGNVRLDVQKTFPYIPIKEPINYRQMKESIFDEFCREGITHVNQRETPFANANRLIPPISVHDVHYAYMEFCLQHCYPTESIMEERAFSMKWGPYVDSLHKNMDPNIRKIAYSNGHFFSGIVLRPDLRPPYPLKLPDLKKYEPFSRNPQLDQLYLPNPVNNQ